LYLYVSLSKKVGGAWLGSDVESGFD
jgi:hypothetical protein